MGNQGFGTATPHANASTASGATMPPGSAVRPVALCVLVTLVVFAMATHNDFVWNSYNLARPNVPTTSLRGVLRLFVPSCWRATDSILKEGYRPVATLSYYVDYVLWGPWPGGYHLSNVLYHALGVALVYVAGVAVFGRRQVALCGALLFACHPARAESVSWTLNRPLLLCAVFTLGSYILLLRSLRDSRASASSQFFWVSSVLFVLALLCKEEAIGLPAIVAAHALLLARGRERARMLKRSVPLWVVAIAFTICRFTILQRGTVLRPDVPDLAIARRWLAVVKTLTEYARLQLLPTNLCVDPAFVIPTRLSGCGVGVFGLALALVTSVAVGAAIGYRHLCYCCAWGMITLLPVVNIVLIPGRPIAEQRLHLPGIGAAWLLGLLVRASPARTRFGGRLVAVPLLILCVLCATLTISRNLIWRQPYSLWRNSVAESPRRSRAFYNYALAAQRSGRIGIAIAAHRKVLRLRPGHRQARKNLGICLALAGRTQEAIEVLREAARLGPDGAELRRELGAALLREGRTEEAERELLRARELDPQNPRVCYLLSIVYRRLGQNERANYFARQAQES